MSTPAKTPAGPYMPQPSSLAALVVAYFARLPDEELSARDIAAKWSIDPHNLAHRLQSAVDAGLLMRDGSVYSAGPQIGRIDLSPGAVMQSSAAPLRRQITVAPPIDMDAIKFEDGYSLNAAQGDGVRRSDLWREKLLTMRAGKSFAIDIAHRNTIAPAMTQLHKEGHGKFAIRTVDAQTIRVFCVALGGKKP